MSYFVVSNIPKCYRSADLRKHFKTFTERGHFSCFHFKHRPEERPVAEQPKAGSSETPQPQTFCCVVRLEESLSDEFSKTFHHKRWSSELNSDGAESNIGVAVIIRTKINDALKKLPELNPPKVMPAGNVGTTTKLFLSLVNKCLLPPAIIKKLQLEFPRTVKRRQYSAVAPSDLYQNRRSNMKKLKKFKSLKTPNKPSDSSNCPSTSSSGESLSGNSGKSSFWSENERVEDHDGAEDWERHESFNNDVGTQDRTKERMYEEDMEIVWDKGSSGLVFYTDSNYWADLEGKDTDGLWADEWDVDMGVYEGHRGDKDARDSQDMRNADQFRKHGDVEEKIGDFEKHTKGFGGRLMRQQGWTAGQGLGKSSKGMSEPMSTEGAQNSKDKTGLGYRGESICDAIRRNNPKPRGPPLIGSKFDDVISHKGSAARTEDPTAMKYRRTKQ
ncbi:G patch domain-containing protein 3-like [Bolinopsis microptera]|uniref:G patch domain-containing protein 3-like n=1 Tax=Bolinopsis microptera TaxID=2820187 RepID=UPI00307AF238